MRTLLFIRLYALIFVNASTRFTTDWERHISRGSDKIHYINLPLDE